MAQLNWIPNQGSFINALQAGAGAGFQSAALQAQAAARQQAMEQARRDQEFQVWRTQEMLRQQAEQNAIENQLKGRQLEAQAAQRMQDLAAEQARQDAMKAHWDAVSKEPKTFGNTELGYYSWSPGSEKPNQLVEGLGREQKNQPMSPEVSNYLGTLKEQMKEIRKNLNNPAFLGDRTNEQLKLNGLQQEYNKIIGPGLRAAGFDIEPLTDQMPIPRGPAAEPAGEAPGVVGPAVGALGQALFNAPSAILGEPTTTLGKAAKLAMYTNPLSLGPLGAAYEYGIKPLFADKTTPAPIVPPGFVVMRNNQGQQVKVPVSDVEKVKAKGYTL